MLSFKSIVKEKCLGKDDLGGEKGKLRKEMGLFGLISFIFGGIVGSGIFVSPILIYNQVQSGGLSLIVWAVTGVIALMGAISYIELGSLIKDAGAEIIYIKTAFSFKDRKPYFSVFGSVLSFSAVWTYVVILRPASSTIVLLTSAEYVSKPFYPLYCEAPLIVQQCLAAFFFVMLALVNIFSSKGVVRLMQVVSSLKFVAIVFIIILGCVKLFSGQSRFIGASLALGVHFDIVKFVLAMYAAFWAYEGWNTSAFCVEEVKKVKYVPMGNLIAVPLVIACYILVNIAYFAVLEPAEIDSLGGEAIALPFAQKVIGRSALFIIPVLVALSTFGAAHSTLFVTSRTIFASARSGLLPRCLSGLHVKYNTPIPALLLHASIFTLFLLFGSIDDLISAFNVAIWIYYFLTFLGLLIMRFTHKEEKRDFKVFFVIPLLMCVISAAVVIIPMVEQPLLSLASIGIILISIPVFFICVFDRTRPRIVSRISDKLNTFVLATFNSVPAENI